MDRVVYIFYYSVSCSVFMSRGATIAKSFTDSTGSDGCENPYVSVGNKCLFFGDSLSLDQNGAQQLCSALNGKLLSIDTAQDFKVLVDFMYNRSDPLMPYWLDGSDRIAETFWLYASGDQVPMGTPFWGTWTTVQDGEAQFPDTDSSRNCLGLGPDEFLYFRDANCDDERRPLCEELGLKMPLLNSEDLSAFNVPQEMIQSSDDLSNITGLSEGSNVPHVRMGPVSDDLQNIPGLSEVSKASPDLKSTGYCPGYSGYLTSSTGTLYSPGWPGNIPASDCYYRIRQAGKRIKITFASFKTGNDYILTIRDGLWRHSRMLGEFSGHYSQDIPDILSSGEWLTLFFVAPVSNPGGFEIHWEGVDTVPSCIKQYTSPTGQLNSPGFPGNYYKNLYCKYSITTDVDKKIKITTSFFETHGSEDYLKVYDGGDSNAPLLLTLYGSQNMVPEITSNSNKLFITFTTDNLFTAGGFNMAWISEKACPLPFVDTGRMCLKFLFSDLSFGQATVSCIADGGTLAAINTAEELREFYLYIKHFGIDDANYWLGGSDMNDEGTWTWKDGSSVPMGTPFWGTKGFNSTTQEPDGSKEQNCIALMASGFFFLRDEECSNANKAVCQYNP